MKRFLVLAFALLFVAAIQVFPQSDLMDGDGSFSYAILSKNHLHPPSSTNPAKRPISADREVRDGASALDLGTPHLPTSLLATVLRC